MLPLDRCKLGQRRFMCKVHIRQRVKMYTRGDRERNAYSLSSTDKQRTRVDMHYFKQARLNIRSKELISILTNEQKAILSEDRACFCTIEAEQSHTPADSAPPNPLLALICAEVHDA